MLKARALQAQLDFKTLFEAAPAPYLVVATDTNFTILAANEAYSRVTGTPTENIIGKGLFEAFPYDPEATGVKNLRASLTRVIQHHVTDTMPIQKYDIRRSEAEGGGFETRYWCPTNVPVFGKDNTLNFIIHRVEDVTEYMLLKQKETEQQSHEEQMQVEIYHHIKKIEQTQKELQISHARYRLLTSILPIGIFHTDPEGHCVYTSSQWQEITGINLNQASGQPWFTLVYPDDVSLVFKAWEDSQKNHHPCKLECRFLLPNEQIRWVLVQLAPEIREGIIQSYVGFMIDVTEQKQLQADHLHLVALQHAEEQQRQRAQMAEENRKRQEQFIDTICHELRNPLNGIFGNIHLLNSDREPVQTLIETAEEDQIDKPLKGRILGHLAQDKESTEAISACAKHQKVITDDVLDFSKLEAGKMEPVLVACDPKEVIQDVVKMLNAEIKNKKLHLYLKLIQVDIEVKSDPKRLKQILINLLTNAIKFTPEGGNITISLAAPQITDNYTLLSFAVKDTGIGMTEEEKDKIFERFTQASQVTYAQYGGSGLGLMISRKLVELMGGNITVKSEPNRGTKFTFTIQCLPLQLQKAPPSTHSFFSTSDASNSLPQATAPTRQHILIVEDNIINQKVMKRFLERAGHDCEIANNGQDAIIMNKTKSFDIIIMDTEMPMMNGLDATRFIRQQEQELKKPSIPIIGLSGNARQEQIEEAKKAGMNDYLTKPHDNNTLLEKIAFYTQKNFTPRI